MVYILFACCLYIPPMHTEDSAAKYFRIGYMLEQRHYLADAYLHYKKAAQAAPETGVYRDKLLRFKSEFWISD